MRYSTLASAGVLMIAPSLSLGEILCQADQQCRGDAQKMCAPSTLRVEVKDRFLWIDAQGPYAARYENNGNTETWHVQAFGGAHRLNKYENGEFLYLCNRGKKYTGTCEVTQ